MIYATMCVGKEWIEKYKTSINNFSKKNTLHILTDNTETFQNTTSYKYNRDVFSYYEKIKFILFLSKKYNERITYIDSDWLDDYNTSIVFDNTSLYTYLKINTLEKNERWFTDLEIQIRDTLLSNIGNLQPITEYIAEALISFPPQNNIDDLILDSETLQNLLEDTYNSETKTLKRLNRYKEGIGYAEGWGISALCVKYNIKIKEVNWRKKTTL